MVRPLSETSAAEIVTPYDDATAETSNVVSAAPAPAMLRGFAIDTAPE